MIMEMLFFTHFIGKEAQVQNIWIIWGHTVD